MGKIYKITEQQLKTLNETYKSRELLNENYDTVGDTKNILYFYAQQRGMDLPDGIPSVTSYRYRRINNKDVVQKIVKGIQSQYPNIDPDFIKKASLASTVEEIYNRHHAGIWLTRILDSSGKPINLFVNDLAAYGWFTSDFYDRHVGRPGYKTNWPSVSNNVWINQNEFYEFVNANKIDTYFRLDDAIKQIYGGAIIFSDGKNTKYWIKAD